MKKSIRDLVLFCVLLMNAKVLAMDEALGEMHGGKPINTEMRDNTTLQQQLERELAEEIEVARNLSLRSLEFFKEYREAFLFDDRAKILETFKPEHPYKINMAQLCRSQLRIHAIEEQLDFIRFPDAKYLIYKVNFSFLKPNPNRWGMYSQPNIDPPFDIDQR